MAEAAAGPMSIAPTTANAVVIQIRRRMVFTSCLALSGHRRSVIEHDRIPDDPVGFEQSNRRVRVAVGCDRLVRF
jgi:hypothetical protein